jgi:hypothetical protein
MALRLAVAPRWEKAGSKVRMETNVQMKFSQVLEIELGVWQRGIVRRRKAEEEIIDFRQLARNSGRCNTQPRLTCMVQ